LSTWGFSPCFVQKAISLLQLCCQSYVFQTHCSSQLIDNLLNPVMAVFGDDVEGPILRYSLTGLIQSSNSDFQIDVTTANNLVRWLRMSYRVASLLVLYCPPAVVTFLFDMEQSSWIGISLVEDKDRPVSGWFSKKGKNHKVWSNKITWSLGVNGLCN